MNQSGVIALRPLQPEDKELLFHWRNLPEIVCRTTAQNTIDRAGHETWFRETISSSRRKLSIVLLNGEPIGQVRFDDAGEGRCAISIYLLPQFTGLGYGVTAIRMGCKKMAA